MYLIEESIKELQAFFQREMGDVDRTDLLFNCKQDDSLNSTWMEYRNCSSIISQVVQYNIESPIRLIEMLKEIWKDNDLINDEEFIRMFVVSAFRQTIRKSDINAEKKEQSNISIPSYIYNF